MMHCDSMVARAKLSSPESTSGSPFGPSPDPPQIRISRPDRYSNQAHVPTVQCCTELWPGRLLCIVLVVALFLLDSRDCLALPGVRDSSRPRQIVQCKWPGHTVSKQDPG